MLFNSTGNNDSCLRNITIIFLRDFISRKKKNDKLGTMKVNYGFVKRDSPQRPIKYLETKYDHIRRCGEIILFLLIENTLITRNFVI